MESQSSTCISSSGIYRSQSGTIASDSAKMSSCHRAIVIDEEFIISALCGTFIILTCPCILSACWQSNMALFPFHKYLGRSAICSSFWVRVSNSEVDELEGEMEKGWYRICGDVESMSYVDIFYGFMVFYPNRVIYSSSDAIFLLRWSMKDSTEVCSGHVAD